MDDGTKKVSPEWQKTEESEERGKVGVGSARSLSDTSRRTDALLRCLWKRKNESSFLGARVPFLVSLSLSTSLRSSVLSSPLLGAMWRGAAVSISLFVGIVIKEGLGEFLSPCRALPLPSSFSRPPLGQNTGQMD